MARQAWWYSPTGHTVAFLDLDGKSFYTEGGQYYAYINNGYIYEVSGAVIGYFDRDGTNIYSQGGQNLGYLQR
jgi:hypothetical protein